MKTNPNTLNHLIQVARHPDKKAALQKDFDAKRANRFIKAIETRPVYIPLKFTLQAAGRIVPYSLATPNLAYPIEILGFITNDASRECSFRRAETDRPFIYVGSEIDVRLTLAELAGISDNAGDGTRGAFYLPEPIHLEAFQRLTVDIFKPLASGTPETVDVILIALRTYRAGLGEGILNAEQRQFINRALAERRQPEPRFLKHRVTFDANGRAKNVYTPQSDEPLLIRGCRSTLSNAKITIRLETEESWTISPVPMWSLTNFGSAENYRRFERPIFLPRGSSLSLELENATGDDADANEGFITWICETV